MMKKRFVLSLITSMILLFAISFSAAAAEESMKITVGSADITAGDTVSLDITIDKNPGVFGFTSEVDYDADSFAFDKAVVKGIFDNNEVMTSKVEDGKLTISAVDSGMDNKKDTGKFVTLTFKTTKSFVNGKHKFKIKEYNDAGKKISGEAIQGIDKDPYTKVIPVEYIDGTVTVSGGSDKAIDTAASNDGSFLPWIIVIAVAAVLVILVVLLFVSQSKKGKSKQSDVSNGAERVEQSADENKSDANTDQSNDSEKS